MLSSNREGQAPQKKGIDNALTQEQLIEQISRNEKTDVQINLFDFQGKASQDFPLIKEMLERLPRTYLIVQHTPRSTGYLS